MENSPRYRDASTNPNPSPRSSSSSTERSESGNPYPTTFVQADTTSFKQVVQMLTGSSDRPKHHNNNNTSSQFSIPPIKAVPNKKQSSGFRLYERRNSMKNLKINPLNPGKPEILSPSILDFPSLVLSPVTPLVPDPFNRSGSSNRSPDDVEEKAMKEKGFYLHPSPAPAPATTPMDQEPRLLPLFPVTSPRVSGSSTAS
ncbi:hypothetical protein F2Q70_00012635 [Brassica cretica]|uniref:VQ domain-containing protein n=1 Tax=Brassica cretica TaxID=69181 RepID=A0A8S9JE46_BRACR|nr:hypothetical protein F2Q68_00005722 [Brassica cretica]KAF2610991.1 hypothetical protein F2Q70_00012635 [Brassica cretica]